MVSLEKKPPQLSMVSLEKKAPQQNQENQEKKGRGGKLGLGCAIIMALLAMAIGKMLGPEIAQLINKFAPDLPLQRRPAATSPAPGPMPEPSMDGTQILANQAQQMRPGDDLGGASPTVLLESGYNDVRDFDGRSESPLSFGEQFCRFLTDYPESITIRQKFLGLLRDVFPEHRLQTNLLSILHGMGIAAEIENSPRIDSAFAFRFEKRLTEEYGIVQNYAEWAVSVWCESYGRRVLGRQCDMSVNPSEDRSG
jgi:hypothetical protein